MAFSYDTKVRELVQLFETLNVEEGMDETDQKKENSLLEQELLNDIRIPMISSDDSESSSLCTEDSLTQENDISPFKTSTSIVKVNSSMNTPLQLLPFLWQNSIGGVDGFRRVTQLNSNKSRQQKQVIQSRLLEDRKRSSTS